MARTSTGITTWELRHGEWVKLSTGPALRGPVWDDPSHYDTIRLGDITGDGRSALIARGVFGVRTSPGMVKGSVGRSPTVTFRLSRTGKRVRTRRSHGCRWAATATFAS